MEAKSRCPLLIVVLLCALNITLGLFYNALTVGQLEASIQSSCNCDGASVCVCIYIPTVPAILVILICDFILILSAMIPKKTIDQCKMYEGEKMGRRLRIVFLTTCLVSFK